MKKKLNIICHAFPSWRGDYLKSTVELMKELAVNHNVLYIDYAYTLKDVTLGKKKNKHISLKRILGLSSPIEKIELDNGAHLNLLSLPPVIPFNWINNHALLKTIQKVNNFIVGLRIKPAMKKLNMQDSIVVNAFNPFFNSAEMKIFQQKATIYYCYDNIDASIWASKHGAWLESTLMNEVDAIVFTSQALEKTKNIKRVPTYVVNNGVDLTVFEKAIQNTDDIKSISNINIGYIGSIDDRLDYELIEKSIIQFPEWQFHFIGRIMTDKCNRLKAYTNTKFYGAIDVKELPNLIKNFSAGIIPFVKNDFTSNIYPMKANEYLVLGLPVVMTDFAELKDLEKVATVANSNTFIEQLKFEVINDTKDKQLMRIDFAKNNSWKNKAEAFEKILYQYA